MTLTFIQTTNLTYILNGNEYSKEDVCLLLEMFGFEVTRSLSYGDFYYMCMESFKQIPADEFQEVFTKFIHYLPVERSIWQQLVVNRRLILSENFKYN